MSIYGDVNVKVEDGNLGRSSSTGTGVHVKIGVSPVEALVPVMITSSMKAAAVKEKLGYSPLADACIDSLDGGSKTIICLPVKASTDGAVGEVKKIGSASGNITATGKPNGSYDVIVRICLSGGTNAGAMQVSIDGGNTYTEETTIPLSGNYVIQNTGLTIKFTGEDDDAFAIGELYEFSTSAPSMNNADLLVAVDRLINYNLPFEYVHVVGTSRKPLWAALASVADRFVEEYKKPLFFLCEGRNKEKDESLDEYYAAMKEERRGINSIYIGVCLAWATFYRLDLRTQDINMAGYITGLLSQAKESQSIGEVESFQISEAKLIRLLPDGIEDFLKLLNDEKYITVRQYSGLQGFYVTNANVMAAEISDFQYIENVRVLNRIVKAVRNQALQKLQMEIDPNDVDGSVAVIKEYLNTALEDAIRDRIISSGEVSIDTESINILVDENLSIDVVYVPMGYARTMDITFGVKNPYKK